MKVPRDPLYSTCCLCPKVSIFCKAQCEEFRVSAFGHDISPYQWSEPCKITKFKPKAQNLPPQAFSPKPQAQNPQSVNPKLKALSPKPPIPNPQPQTLRPEPQTLSPKPQTLSPKLQALNLEPSHPIRPVKLFEVCFLE